MSQMGILAVLGHNVCDLIAFQSLIEEKTVQHNRILALIIHVFLSMHIVN
jgi:hypothetical protein